MRVFVVWHAPVGLRGSLKCVLSPMVEKQVIAMCEVNTLADTPLGFVEVKEAIEQMVEWEVSKHVVRDLFGTEHQLAYIQAWQDDVLFTSNKQHCCRNRAVHHNVGEAAGEQSDHEVELDCL